MKNCIICDRDACVPSHRQGAFTYVRCTACGTFALRPMPVDTRDLYSDDYFSGATRGYGYVDYASDKEPMRPVFNRFMKRIEVRHPRHGALLDVGAADGFFTLLAQERGWRVSGVEVSDAAASRARVRGLDIQTGGLDAVPTGSRFDVITLWDVIEHIPDPVAAMARVRDLLAPGGTVVLTTPDAGSVWARLMGRRWHAFVPPEHVCLMGDTALRALASRTGFRVLVSEGISKRFTVAYVLSVVRHWLGRGAVQSSWLAGSVLGRIPLRIPIRDNRFMLLQADV